MGYKNTKSETYIEVVGIQQIVDDKGDLVHATRGSRQRHQPYYGKHQLLCG